MHRVVLNTGLTVFILIMFVGCTPKAYRDALNTAVRMENQKEYEQAYEYYSQALKTKPNDEHAKLKLTKLGRIIAIAYTEDAEKALENKKYKTALDLLNKALSYDEHNEKTNNCRLEARKKYDQIQDKYSQIEDLTAKNQWLKVVSILKDISKSYNDDPDLENQIVKSQDQGYHFFVKSGQEARKSGNYSQSLSYFESADLLKTSTESQQEIKIAKKYVEAESIYIRAWHLSEKASILEAMEALIQAKDLVVDHEKVNKLIIKLTPDWSPIIFNNAKMFKESNQIERAFDAIYQLNRINPEYPETEKYFEEIKSLYLNKSYKNLLEAQSAEDLPLIVDLSQNIFKVDPEFLDTAEIMARTAIKSFNLFYQQGLNYIETGNHGKAILCFRSAEQQLAETRLTRELIRESWEQIREESSLKMVFLDFSQGISDLSVSRYITEKIKKRLEDAGGKKRFKNISVALGATQEYDMITRSGMSSDIDWGSVLQEGYNAVFTGRIKLLKQETSVNSEWKTRKRMVNRIVDNEEYSRLIIRRASLKLGLISDYKAPKVDNEKYLKVAMKRDIVKANLESDMLTEKVKQKLQRKMDKLDRYLERIPAKRWMSGGEMEDELELIEEKLPTIPPKIEAEVEEETPYQLVKHTMTAYMQIVVEILSPGGNPIWPVKHYEDTFQIEDSVTPPNLASEDPNERMGDPLTLPSESVFKEQAIDYILDKRILPDLVEDFNSYGIQFYKRANKLNILQNGSNHAAREFLDSFEEYYRFLACYKDKGEEDTLREDVEKKLESHISDLWLLRKKKI